jgi:hypothetical protein
MDSLRLDKFRVSMESRKGIVARIKELQPTITNRQIARTLGVGHQTVGRDIGPDRPPGDGSSEGAVPPTGPRGPQQLSGRQVATTIHHRGELG